MNKLAWLLEDNEKCWQEECERVEAIITAKYGPRCEVCGWPINHSEVQWVPHPGKTHDCFTGDPLAR
jgi:hypothetical protein